MILPAVKTAGVVTFLLWQSIWDGPVLKVTGVELANVNGLCRFEQCKWGETLAQGMAQVFAAMARAGRIPNSDELAWEDGIIARQWQNLLRAV